MTSRPTLLLFLGTLLLVGCMDSDGVILPTTVDRPAPATSAATTTSAVDAACPDVPTPAGDASRSSSADLDGDGSDDRLSVFPGAVLWADLSGGGSASAELGDVDPVLPVGGVDLDEDGDDEAWIVAGSGAATQRLVLLDLQDCRLEPISPPGGLPVGATVRNASGLSCEDADGDGRFDTVVHAQLSSSDGERYVGTATRYRSTSGGLEPVSIDDVAVSVSDPGGVPLGGFSCGGLRLG